MKVHLEKLAVVLFLLVFISSCSKKFKTTNDEKSLDPNLNEGLNELLNKDYIENMTVDFKKNTIEIKFKPSAKSI